MLKKFFLNLDFKNFCKILQTAAMIFNELQQTPTTMIKGFAAVFLQFRIGAENLDEDQKKVFNN